MAIDTSIYGQIRPFKMDDPIEKQAQLYQLEGARRKFQLDDDISAIGAATGGDPAKMSSMLLERGHYQPAMQMQAQAAALDKEKRLATKADVDRKLKLWEHIGSAAMGVDQAYRQALQASGGDEAAAIQRTQPIWNEVRARSAELGLNLPEQFDPQKNFAGISMAKENIQYLKTLAPDVRMTDTGGSITPTNVNPLAGAVGPLPGAQPIPKTAGPAQPTELARLTSERDALPEGSPQRAQYDRVIASYKAGRATDVTIQQPGPMLPGKEGQNKVDEALLKTTGRLSQVFEISSRFRPEFQQLGTKIDNAISSGKDILGLRLTNKEQADLNNYNDFRASAGELYAQTLKEMAGTALTEGEVKIHSAYLPRPGTGLTDGDSPSQMRTKIDRLNRTLKMSVARLAYIKRNGMSLEDGQGNAVVSLDRMPTLINERGREIESQLKTSQPDVKGESLKRAVRRQLGVEFGIVSD